MNLKLRNDVKVGGIGLLLFIAYVSLMYVGVQYNASPTTYEAEASTVTGDSFIRYVQADALNDSLAVAKANGLTRADQIVAIEWSTNENWTVIYTMRR
jgi:hypothetical protein